MDMGMDMPEQPDVPDYNKAAREAADAAAKKKRRAQGRAATVMTSEEGAGEASVGTRKLTGAA